MTLGNLSLFSGVGGLDLAAEMAGIKTVGMCEFADYPRRVLARHWPHVPKWRDIRTLTKESFYERTGLSSVDIVSGGFPCQPFSVAGQRRGTADDRYLWPEMLRVVEEIRPAWVVGENVAGLVSMVESVMPVRVEGRTINRTQDADYYEAIYTQQEHMLLTKLIRDLECIGYEVQAFTFPASAVGAPHRRDRIAIVGYTKHNGLSTAAKPGGIAAAGNNKPQGSYTSGKPSGAGRYGDCADVADTEGSECERPWRDTWRRRAEFRRGCRRRTQPGLGGTFDGATKWLDEIGGLSEGAKDRAREILHNLRGETVQESIQWTIGRFSGVSEAEVLLALLCEYEESLDGVGIPPESSVITGELVRNLWRHIEAARTPYRHGYNKQFAREYSNALYALSQQLPSLYPQAWANGCWEDGLPRVANGVVDRVERLKALGNMVVPQQFYPIYKAIVDIEMEGMR